VQRVTTRERQDVAGKFATILQCKNTPREKIEARKEGPIQGRKKMSYYRVHNITMALLTIKKTETSSTNSARTFTNFHSGTVDFRHIGVLVSRICTIF
jgi:hypothetical protein